MIKFMFVIGGIATVVSAPILTWLYYKLLLALFPAMMTDVAGFFGMFLAVATIVVVLAIVTTNFDDEDGDMR